MKFTVNHPDYELSPYTGMNRKHWLDLCHFYLEGIFSHVEKIDDPIIMPRNEFDISYPRPDGPIWRLAAERFEGLARTLLIAAPLLYNEPDATVCGYSMKEYYKKQILASVTPGNQNYLMKVEEIIASGSNGELVFQHTCECATLAICLMECRKVLWDDYAKEEKDLIAAYLSNFGHAKTSHHNWRLFNMLILAFLHHEGYAIDKDMMRDHAAAIVAYYAGDGWYRDGHLFDYYCPWAFHVYAPLWNTWYGYEEEPYIAEKFEQYSGELVEEYANMFDKDAHVTMWGRSGIYRNAASSPLAGNFFLKNPKADPGLARRITSGAALQFAQKEECFVNDILCIGFYGPFGPMVQSYSCAASPAWIANSFICLYLPENHPFWTEKETNGIWDKLKKGEVHTSVWNGPGIVVDNFADSGATQFRTAKILMKKDNPSLNAYMRLGFHSAYPWEDFDFAGVESMQYSLKYYHQEKAQIPNVLFYGGARNGVLYRREFFDFEFTFQDKSYIDLADFTVKNGMIRVDRVHLPDKPFTLTLGGYSVPDDKTVQVEEREKEGVKAIIIKSDLGQTAFVTYTGFDAWGVKNRQGLNPISVNSFVAYGESKQEKYYEYRAYAKISAILYKSDRSTWTDEELFPINKIMFADSFGCGGYGPIKVSLVDGRLITVDFEGTEGRITL